MAKNLFEYYQEQGQKLPSVAERSSVYEAQGLGSASEYRGTAEQNIALLDKLQNSGGGGSITIVDDKALKPNSSPAGTPTPDQQENQKLVPNFQHVSGEQLHVLPSGKMLRLDGTPFEEGGTGTPSPRTTGGGTGTPANPVETVDTTPDSPSTTGGTSKEDAELLVSNTVPETNAELAKLAGQAGLSLKEYYDLVGRGATLTKEESDKIRVDLGLDELEDRLFKKPDKSSEEVYKKAYQTSGLVDLKQKILAVNRQIDDEQRLFDEAINEINENPFLSEKTRVGEGRLREESFNRRMSRLEGRRQSFEDLYDDGIEEINGIVQRNQTDFGISQAIDEAKFNYLNAVADREAERQFNEKVNEGIDLETFVEESFTASESPKVFGGASTGYWTYDPTLKKFKQVVAPVVDSTADEREDTRVSEDLNTIRGVMSRLASSSASDDEKRVSFNQIRSQFIADNPDSGKVFDDIFNNSVYSFIPFKI